MSKNIKTYLFCFDDHRGLTEEVKKQFTDSSKYMLFSFPTREGLIDRLEQEREHRFCKVAILGLHDTKEHFEMIDQLTRDIKKIDFNTRLVLLGPPDKIEEIKKAVKFNIDSYIPHNSNSMLRLHNAVKKLISEHGIRIFRKKKNISIYITVGFLLLCLLLIFFSYFRFPQYF
jgi:DNA-binding NarL/FixJ family response regulator